MLPGEQSERSLCTGNSWTMTPGLWSGSALTSSLPSADSLTFAMVSHGVLDAWGQCTEPSVWGCAPDVHTFSIHTFPTTPPACFQFEATACTVITGGRPGMVAQALEMSWGCESHFLLEFGKPG